MQLAVATYIATIDIGGIAIDAVGGLGVPIEAITGAIFHVAAADGTEYIENVTGLTLNAVAASVALTSVEVARSTTVTVTVHVV